MSSIDPALLALAGFGLTDSWPLPSAGWDQRLDSVFKHGLAGSLGLAFTESLVGLDKESVSRLERRLEGEATRAVQIEGELFRIAEVLAEFDAIVLKGAVLAHGAYPDPGLRPFTDLDLLVSGRRHAAAVEALQAFGYSRTRPEPAPRYDSTVGKALTLSHPGGVVIDLHRTLVPGLAGASIDVDSMLANRIMVRVGDQLVPAPSWEAHLVEVCLHAVVGDGLQRAISIRDVAQVAVHPHLDAQAAVDLARIWKVGGIFADALRAAVDGVGVTLPPLLASQPGAVHPPEPENVRSARSRLAEIRHGDVRRRVTLIRSLLTPSNDFLRSSYGDQPKRTLYVRRWRQLITRTAEARSPKPRGEMEAPPSNLASAPTSPEIEPPVDSPSDEARRVPPVASAGPFAARARMANTKPVARATTRTEPAFIAIASRAQLAPLSLTRLPATEPDRGPADPGDGVAPRSRQQIWADERPLRPMGSAGGPLTPPTPPAPGTTAATGAQPNPTLSDAAVAGADAAAPASGVAPFIGGVILLALTAIGARLGANSVGVALVPIAALLLAWAASRRITRRRPDEAWVGQWLVLGTVVKLAASYARYLTLVIGYEGVGDSTDYDRFGTLLARSWMGKGVAPHLDNLRETNFLRWFTGVVYFCFGSDMVAGFFIFGLLALVGSYLWYRATADAVPFIDKRIYLGLVLFAPSIVFWPSSIGKESMMQLGIGAMALGTAYLLRQRLIHGLLVGLAGGWLLWVVRPHLLALVTVATAFAYFVGRVRPAKAESRSVVVRTIGLLFVGLLVAFAIGQAAQFLGIKDLSYSSIEGRLEEQSTLNQTGSNFDNGSDYLSPANLPRGVATVLLRPFPWETSSPFQLLASLESVLVAILLVVRFASIRTSLARARGTPFLLYCWVLTILYAATFASFSNFGLLVRQRSLVLPALFVLVAVRPIRDRSTRADELASRETEPGVRQ